MCARHVARCHPDISDVCNRHFYDNRLEDGVGPDQRPSLVPGMPHAVAVVDVQGQEQYRGRSIYNDAEARAVGLLIRNLLQAGVAPGDIGVIAFYRAHVEALKRCVGAVVSCGGGGGGEGEGESHGTAGTGGGAEVQIATVDSFQGAEKQVIILSTATTKASQFVSEPTRLNVALSRAKNHLFLVSSQALLRSVPSLSYVLRRSQAKGGYFVGGAKFG
jgi:superfamily I DNA and/or RNA helicase